MSRLVLIIILLIFLFGNGCAIGSVVSDLPSTPAVVIVSPAPLTSKPIALSTPSITPVLMSPLTSQPTLVSTLALPNPITPTRQEMSMPLNHLSNIICAILDTSQKFNERNVEVVGYFRGWDLLDEVRSEPPVTRSDWVIADRCGAIYVTGLMPTGLNPSSRADIWTVVRLRATVVYAPTGSVYLKGLQVDVVAPTQSSAPISSTKVPERWRIDLAFSGGIAGLRRVVELTDTGQLTVIDQKVGRQVIAQVSATELGEIASSLSAVERFQPSGRLPSCRDCFQYELVVDMDGRRFQIQLNDQVLAESELAPLINVLVHLQERALSGQLKP